jgi:hypothetical protein
VNNVFTKHPHSVGETYIEHGLIALYGAYRLAMSAALFVFHAVFTFIPVPKPYDLQSTTDWLNSICNKRKEHKPNE